MEVELTSFWLAGVALTCFALVAATVGIKQGRREYANNMMRLRGMRLWHYAITTILTLLTFHTMMIILCEYLDIMKL